MLPSDFWILIERYPKAMIQIKIFVAQKNYPSDILCHTIFSNLIIGQALETNFLTNSYLVVACREASQKKVIKAP